MGVVVMMIGMGTHESPALPALAVAVAVAGGRGRGRGWWGRRCGGAGLLLRSGVLFVDRLIGGHSRWRLTAVAVHVAEMAAAQVMNGGRVGGDNAQAGSGREVVCEEGGAEAGFAVEPPGVTQGIDTLASVACRPAVRDAVLQGAHRLSVSASGVGSTSRDDGSATASIGAAADTPLRSVALPPRAWSQLPPS